MAPNVGLEGARGSSTSTEDRRDLRTKNEERSADEGFVERSMYPEVSSSSNGETTVLVRRRGLWDEDVCSSFRREAPKNEEGHQQHGAQDVNSSVNSREANGCLDVSASSPDPMNVTYRLSLIHI